MYLFRCNTNLSQVLIKFSSCYLIFTFSDNEEEEYPTTGHFNKNYHCEINISELEFIIASINKYYDKYWLD